MAPKTDKKKDDEGIKVFSEVERALYELQLADCNSKLARLRSAVSDYEVRNEELQKAYDKLDIDRADIIAYLKKTLNVKNDENTELKEKIKGLEELRQIETAQFKETVTELEKNFRIMKDQLTSENKLLAGKLNTLEEFKAIRDDLMQKFETQEHSFEEQEMKYKRMLYDAEKKFVMGKDRLKREMERRLLQLAQEFQDSSEIRIAASTHRVLRENIALNNQLDSLLTTQAKVAEQNEKLREDELAACIAKEAAEEERDKAINKSIVQLKVIDQLTAAFIDVKKEKAQYNKNKFENEKLQSKMQKLTKDNENLLLQVRILEQNLHATLGGQNKSVVETAKLLREMEKYKKILKDSAFAVQAALKLDHWSKLNPAREVVDREIVLNKILRVINQYRDVARAESMESLISLSRIYEKGDLGFTPKPALSRRSMVSQAGMVELSLETLEDKRSAVSESSSSYSSLASVKTVPSIDIIPPEEGPLESSKASLPSFTITSVHSSEQEEIELEQSLEEIQDIEKLLEKSKIEMQKSLMLEFARSQIMLQSQLNLPGTQRKSEILHEDVHGEKVAEEAYKGEGGGSYQDIEGERTKSGSDVGKHGEDEEKHSEAKDAKSATEQKPDTE